MTTRSTEKQLMGQDKQIIWIDGLFGYIANWHIKLVKDFSSAWFIEVSNFYLLRIIISRSEEII